MYLAGRANRLGSMWMHIRINASPTLLTRTFPRPVDVIIEADDILGGLMDLGNNANGLSGVMIATMELRYFPGRNIGSRQSVRMNEYKYRASGRTWAFPYTISQAQPTLKAASSQNSHHESGTSDSPVWPTGPVLPQARPPRRHRHKGGLELTPGQHLPLVQVGRVGSGRYADLHIWRLHVGEPSRCTPCHCNRPGPCKLRREQVGMEHPRRCQVGWLHICMGFCGAARRP